MDEKANTPSIRFAGFADAWEQRKVKDVSNILGGNAWKSSDYQKDGEFLVVTIANVTGDVQIKTDTGNRINCSEPGIYRLSKDDILISLTGNVGRASKVPDIHAVLNQRVAKLIPTSTIDRDFLFQSVHNTLFENAMVEAGQGAAQKNISNSDVVNYKIGIPNKKEQQQVARFFSNIDSLITLHQHKHDKLVNLKKSMLEKMFPQHGADVPEIRFAGFTDAWEQRKFGTLYAKSSEKNDGRIGVDRNITVATMQFKPDVKVSTDDYLKTYYTFNIGDIAFEGHQSKEFRFGRFVANDIENGIVSHIFAVFRPIVEYDLRFWKYAINNERLMQAVLSRSTKASTMMHDLVVVDFLNEEFLVPAIDEQKAIGDFLTKLDHLIALHQRKLIKLQNIKKSCLEKMFV